jgi:hypothetical protein
MALFSRIVNYQEVSTQKMKEDYGELHPKILDLGMRLINESYQSSNQRCIAMLLALKSFVNVIINSLYDCRISKLLKTNLYTEKSRLT